MICFFSFNFVLRTYEIVSQVFYIEILVVTIFLQVKISEKGLRKRTWTCLFLTEKRFL